MSLVSFSLIIGTIALLGHLYLYRRLVRPAIPDPRVRRGLAVLLTLLGALLLLRSPIRALGPEIANLYTVVAFGWMAVALCMLLATLFKDVVAGVLATGHWLGARRQAAHPTPTTKATSHAPSRTDAASAVQRPAAQEAGPVEQFLSVDLGRRQLLSRSLHVGAMFGGGVTAAYGAHRAFAPAEVSEVQVRLPRLPRTLEGLRIVQLSDIHVGAFINAAFIEDLVERSNAQRPDAVVITGDLVDGSVDALGSAVAHLTRLRSRYGTYFVTGNHEYYSGHWEWCRLLEKLGITVLRNRHVQLGDTGGAIDLVGVDDWAGARRFGGPAYDLEAALAGRDPARGAVLLAHQPVNFETAVARGVGLQLSGHTHGGQVFPMTLLVQMRYPYNRGLYRHGDSHIYVSRGCGFWGPPTRVGSPPEIVTLHLIG